MQAVILCGGFGTRLKDVVSDVPKPMAPINEKPFLSYLVANLAQQGFNNVVFLTGYKSEPIEDYFKENGYGLDCSFVREESPLGTGGALLNAWTQLEQEFVLLNGDTFFDIDFSLLFDFSQSSNAGTCVALRACDECSRYGVVDINERFQVKSFIEKSAVGENTEGLINGGIYYFKKSALEEYYKQWKQDFISIETQIFPSLVEEKQLYALPLGGMFIDIGIPEDYNAAQKSIPNWVKQQKKPAVIFVSEGLACKSLVLDYKNKGFYTFFFQLEEGNSLDKAFFDDVVSLRKEPYSKTELSQAILYKILQMAEKYKINLKKSVILLNNAKINNINLPYIEISDVTGAP